MKKLVEIPFNHELIGKEGIVIKCKDSSIKIEEIFLSKSKMQAGENYPILLISNRVNLKTNISWHTLKGKFNADSEEASVDMIMYQEVEVKEPKEVFIIETLSGEIVCTVQTIKQAENIIHHLALTKNYKYKITKFIEVIEEGE